MSLANMPEEMRAYKNWVAWRLETVGGRKTNSRVRRMCA